MNPSVQSPDAQALAADIAQRCEQACHTADGWQACCPAHEDTTPSLSITPAQDKVLLHCHAGCENKAIVAALGLTLADLFLSPRPKNRSKNRPGHIHRYYDYHDRN